MCFLAVSGSFGRAAVVALEGGHVFAASEEGCFAAPFGAVAVGRVRGEA